MEPSVAPAGAVSAPSAGLLQPGQAAYSNQAAAQRSNAPWLGAAGAAGAQGAVPPGPASSEPGVQKGQFVGGQSGQEAAAVGQAHVAHGGPPPAEQQQQARRRRWDQVSSVEAGRAAAAASPSPQQQARRQRWDQSGAAAPGAPPMPAAPQREQQQQAAEAAQREQQQQPVAEAPQLPPGWAAVRDPAGAGVQTSAGQAGIDASASRAGPGAPQSAAPGVDAGAPVGPPTAELAAAAGAEGEALTWRGTLSLPILGEAPAEGRWFLPVAASATWRRELAAAAAAALPDGTRYAAAAKPGVVVAQTYMQLDRRAQVKGPASAWRMGVTQPAVGLLSLACASPRGSECLTLSEFHTGCIYCPWGSHRQGNTKML